MVRGWLASSAVGSGLGLAPLQGRRGSRLEMLVFSVAFCRWRVFRKKILAVENKNPKLEWGKP